MESLRRHTDYGEAQLTPEVLGNDPLAAFANWLREAEGRGIYEPNAFVLGTVDSAGIPNARTVLLKGIENGEFFFASNYLSQKGLELEDHPAVSMLFGWYIMHRQVRIQGTSRRSSVAESEAYFQSRPHDSQVASLVSEQSQPISSRAELESRFDKAISRFAGIDVPTPEYWGGYWIKPHRIEFWQGRSDRMHDRIDFRLGDSGDWFATRLQP